MLWLGAARLASADEPKPWADGVSEEQQQAARAIFDEGNALLHDGLYAQALDVLRDALARWDHPQIRYNAAIALINLQRPLEALAELELALRYGGDGIDPALREQALGYRRLLESQTASLTVECVDAGAEVTLDGDALLDCPGSRTVRVLAGAHRVVGARAGSLTRAVSLALDGGAAHVERIDLWTEAEATVTTRRWAWWKPWAVVAGGAALGAIGVGLQLDARAELQGYDNAVAALCPDAPCDDLPDNVEAALVHGRRESRIAVGVMVVAGAVVATGLAGAWWNRERHDRIGYEVQAGPGEVGVAVRGSF